VANLAQESGRQPAELGALLAGLADRGLVYQRVTVRDAYYSLLPVIPGLAEVQFMSGEVNPVKRHLAGLFNAYYAPGVGKSMTQAGAAFGRVIPVGRAVPNRQEILPFEEAEYVLRQHKHLSLANCYCRHEADLLGHGCGKPKDVCLTFGPFAEFLVAKGFSQTADLKMALAALERAEMAGLVHVTDNVADGATFLCNCCGCCCVFLKTITQLKAPGAVAQAAYLAQVDPDQCVACGQCREICQVAAPEPDEDTYVVNPALCLGCGHCQQVCPTGAMTMVRKQRPAPPADRAALAAALKQKSSDPAYNSRPGA
jgi:Pyruvate/2-oxoacid:ferredoxin oxidoreductase delta subunit